jgi:beta-glucosidase
MTFPRNVGCQCIIITKIREGPRWISQKVCFGLIILTKRIPVYPFGHGLSYTRFEYSNLQLSSQSFGLGGNYWYL